MAFNYLNGVPVGLETSVSTPYSHGARQMRRLIYLWLTHIVGWADVDKSGANWDNPQLATRVDGATDATNPSKFTSATGGFTAAMVGSLLMAKGFTDSTRSGFYMIRAYESTNTIYVDTWYGVHSDGLPLGETGITFEVHKLTTAALMPANTNFFVARGTGVGGTFDLRCYVDSSANYAPDHWDISPYPDWDAGADAWLAPARYSSQSAVVNDNQADIGYVWGFADMTQAFVFVRYYTYQYVAIGYPMVFYFGDITPFHAAEDTRPVICGVGRSDSGWSEIAALRTTIAMVAGDNSQSAGRLVYPTENADSATTLGGSSYRTRSWHSKKFERFPLVVASEVGGKEEIRGVLKNIDMGHLYGPRELSPLGLTRDRFRPSRVTIPWNGSKQLRYMEP